MASATVADLKAYLAQSAFAQSPAASGLDLSSEIIVCTPYSDIAEYYGTRSALEAEGIIPPGTKWPEGFDDLRWEDDKCRYWLRRERPEGVKGPRRLFLQVDWWMLRFVPLNAKPSDVRNVEPSDVRNVERKKKELAEILYRQSIEGKAEWNKQYDRYLAARKDEKFQAFKSIIPGINRPKRGRRPKNGPSKPLSFAERGML